MASFPLRIPDDLKEAAARYIAARGARAVRGRSREIFSRSGIGNEPRDDDRLE